MGLLKWEGDLAGSTAKIEGKGAGKWTAATSPGLPLHRGGRARMPCLIPCKHAGHIPCLAPTTPTPARPARTSLYISSIETRATNLISRPNRCRRERTKSGNRKQSPACLHCRQLQGITPPLPLLHASTRREAQLLQLQAPALRPNCSTFCASSSQMRENRCWKIRGIRPASGGYSSSCPASGIVPSMVHVLPLPVWPYACRRRSVNRWA